MRKVTRASLRRLTAAAVVVAAGAGLLAPSGASADVRVSPNFALLPDRNPIYGRDGLGLAVNPRNPRHLVAVYADWHSLWCEVAMSRDGGRSWRRSRLRAPEGFIDPPCTVGSHLSQLIDQSVAFGSRGNVYATFASASADEESPEGQSALVARSTDGGRSFETAVVAMRGGEAASVGPDFSLPKLAVAPARRRSQQDRVFLVAGSNQQAHDTVAADTVAFGVSDDAGRTWSPPRDISEAGQNSIEASNLAIGKGGDLFVAWRTRDPGARPGSFGAQGTIVVGRSSDSGATWTRVPVARVEGYIYQGPAQPPFSANQFFTASSFARIAADRRSGNVYVAYGNGNRPTRPDGASAADHFIHPDMDVWFQRSTDAGRTWSDPTRLNGQPKVFAERVTQTRHPTLSVARNGRLDVVWNDRRHWYRGCLHTHVACEEARLQDIYYRYSTNGGKSFAPERRITDRSMNGDVGFDYRFGSYWDYGPVSVPIGKDGVLVGWMDSRDGNVETDSMGAWLARVDHSPSRRIPVRRVRARNLNRLAARLSQLAYPAGPEAVLAGTFATRPSTRAVVVNKDDIPGMLAGGVLARANLGSVLPASRGGGLSEAVQQELRRLAPVGAYIVGGDAVPATVEQQLVATGIPADQIVRIRRGTPAETVADVARAMDRRTQAQKDESRPAFDAALLVHPNSRDAAAASVLAANRRLPVLFVQDANTLPAATTQALDDLDIDRVLVVGGTDVVSDAVLGQLPRPERLNGSTPVGTSRSVLLSSRDHGVPGSIVFTARADRPRTAALLGGAVGRIGGLLLLTDRKRSAREALEAIGIADEVDRIVHVGRGSGRR